MSGKLIKVTMWVRPEDVEVISDLGSHFKYTYNAAAKKYAHIGESLSQAYYTLRETIRQDGAVMVNLPNITVDYDDIGVFDDRIILKDMAPPPAEEEDEDVREYSPATHYGVSGNMRSATPEGLVQTPASPVLPKSSADSDEIPY